MVSAMAVEQYDRFHPHAVNYLINTIRLLFNDAGSFKKGSILATDFTNYLSPQANDLGFGTGTSFIAELYLLWGVPTLIAGVLFLGMVMSYLKNYLSGISGTMAFIILMGCVYLPRSSYFDPITGMIKYGAPCLLLYFVTLLITLLIHRKIKLLPWGNI